MSTFARCRRQGGRGRHRRLWSDRYLSRSFAVIRPACAIVLALALSSGASAQTQDERFAEIDRNGDGLITYEEHAAADEAEFREIDADGNGTLVLKEYAAWLGGQGFPAPVALSVAKC